MEREAEEQFKRIDDTLERVTVRLDKLTERQDALAESLELTSQMHRDNENRFSELGNRLGEQLGSRVGELGNRSVEIRDLTVILGKMVLDRQQRLNKRDD